MSGHDAYGDGDLRCFLPIQRSFYIALPPPHHHAGGYCHHCSCLLQFTPSKHVSIHFYFMVPRWLQAYSSYEAVLVVLWGS